MKLRWGKVDFSQTAIVRESRKIVYSEYSLASFFWLCQDQVRKEKVIPELRADGKTQVSAEYKDGKIARLDAIVVSTQHDEFDTEDNRHFIVEPLTRFIVSSLCGF